jgi:hypothetical protein
LQDEDGYYNRNYRSLELTGGDDGVEDDVTGVLTSLSSTDSIGAFPLRRFESLLEVDLSGPASSGRPVDLARNVFVYVELLIKSYNYYTNYTVLFVQHVCDGRSQLKLIPTLPPTPSPPALRIWDLRPTPKIVAKR